MVTDILSTFARRAAAMWALGGMIYLVAEAVAASAFPHYSYANNYISDLGVPEVGSFQGRPIDSPLSGVMNFAYLAQGVLFFIAVVSITRAVRVGPRKWLLSLAAVHAVGIILVGFFHGSQTNVDNGLFAVHALGAAMAIIAGNLVAIVGGVGSGRVRAALWYRVISIVLGAVGIFSLVMLQVDTMSSSINIFAPGIWERASVYTIIGWEIFTAICLAVAQRRGDRRLG